MKILPYNWNILVFFLKLYQNNSTDVQSNKGSQPCLEVILKLNFYFTQNNTF